jgi:hypothetical protein
MRSMAILSSSSKKRQQAGNAGQAYQAGLTLARANHQHLFIYVRIVSQ